MFPHASLWSIERDATVFHVHKSDFDVIVLGAGVVGINTAYWNLRNGKSVCVIDRQPAAGLETSFANGGQVSVSHAEPWANPSAPFKVLKWLFDSDAPLLFRPTLRHSSMALDREIPGRLPAASRRPPHHRDRQAWRSKAAA